MGMKEEFASICIIGLLRGSKKGYGRIEVRRTWSSDQHNWFSNKKQGESEKRCSHRRLSLHRSNGKNRTPLLSFEFTRKRLITGSDNPQALGNIELSSFFGGRLTL